jgi:hypothetical protein
MDEMSGADILAIPRSRAARLFGDGRDRIGKTFRKLAVLWHPDRNRDPQAAAVFAHLVELRDAALGRSGARPRTSERVFRRADGSSFALRAIRSHRLDVGEVIVGASSLSWRFDAAASDIAEAEVSRIAGFRFADAAMEREMRRLLPKISRRIDLEDGVLLVQPRRPGDVLLIDLIAAHGGAVPPEHVAWIGSGLFNIACWLDWAGLVHGAIAPETVLIDSATHDVRLVGGFGFAFEEGSRPEALPARSLDLAPRLSLKGQVAERTFDGDLVRLTLREALGHIHVTSAPKMKMTQALLMPPEARAVDDYRSWHAVLDGIWGKRRFQVMDLDAAAIYGA